MKLKKIALAVALISLGPVNASADVFTSQATGLSGVLSGKYSGSFNISSQLSALSGYQITSASLSFSFMDYGSGAFDTSALTPSSYTAGNYTLKSNFYNFSDYIYQYLRQVESVYFQTAVQQVASAALTVGGNAAGSGQGSTHFDSNVTTYDATARQLDSSVRRYYGYGYSCGNRCSGYSPGLVDEYYSDLHETHKTAFYSSQGSQFSIFNDLTASPSLLSELSSTGLLSFDLDVTNAATLVSATLQYEAMPTPVPEPETYALMSIGLSLMGFIARRRRSVASS